MPITALPDKEAQYAYHCIRDFFDDYGLSGAVADIESILQAAVSNKSWKKAAPFTAVLFMKKLAALCTAAFVIHQNSFIVGEAVLKQPEDGIPDLAMFGHVGDQRSLTIWDCFPRNLTADQYYDPYKAIKKFTACMPEPEWQKALADCTEYALSNEPIDDIHPPYNILTLRLRMLQLVEACWLLHVRTHLKAEPAAQQA